MAGSAILGPVGALLALPVAATVTALSSTYLQRHDLVSSPMFDPGARPASALPVSALEEHLNTDGVDDLQASD